MASREVGPRYKLRLVAKIQAIVDKALAKAEMGLRKKLGFKESGFDTGR